MNRQQRAAITLASIILSGCGGQEKDDSSGQNDNGPDFDPQLTYQLFQSSVERDPSPAIDDSNFEKLTNDNNRFAIKLFKERFDSDKNNSIFSPYSISSALAMTYVGAAGETKAEMADALEFKLPESQLHAGFNRSLQTLEQRNFPETAWSAPQEVLVTNAIWPYVENSPAEPFLDTLAREYGASVYGLDYVSEPEACRITINEQVAQWTNGYITDLLPAGSIDANTRMVITSSIYFFSPWTESFGENTARPKAFHNLNGATVDVPSMTVRSFADKAETADAIFGALTFHEVTMAMLFIMPTVDFVNFVEGFTEEKLREGIAQMKFESGFVQIPKFKLESELRLKDSLKALGMETAFGRNADFNPMDIGNVYIEEVVHKAVIDVNEAGTTAAAATAVRVPQPSASVPPTVLVVDRPFIYMIYDRETNTVLFMGHIANF